MKNNLDNAKQFLKNKMPDHLSGGDARQLEIARCMVDWSKELNLTHEELLFKFYNYVLDEHNGDLHEYQISMFLETLSE